MEVKIEQEYNVTDKQFKEGTAEMIKMTTDTLKIFKRVYRETKDLFVQAEIEKYTSLVVDLMRLLKSYKLRADNGIGVQPIVVFGDGTAIFGYKGKREMEFSEKWYKIITKKRNGKEMVI